MPAKLAVPESSPMAELRTAVGTLISKQRELSSSYASPISAARSALRSRRPVRPGWRLRRLRARRPGLGAEPAERGIGHLVQARLVPVPAERLDRDGEPLGRLTPARSSSASRPILAPQTPTASSGATSLIQAMASGTGNQPCPFGACLSTVTRPAVPSTSTSSPSAITIVASPAAVTVGTPYSRPTMAAWDRVPPPSQTQAAILAKAGVQFGEGTRRPAPRPG